MFKLTKKPSQRPLARPHNSDRGGALLLALIISFFGVVLVTSLGQYFSGLTKTVLKNNDIGALRAALHSSMDYTLNGVRNRWCFSNTWTPNPICKITDANNVERLLISDEALRAVESVNAADPSVYGGNISAVRTKSIVGSVRLIEITPDHPLFYVANNLKDVGDDFTFNFKIIRIDNGVQKGREVLIQVEVELDLGVKSILKTSQKISAVSSVMVFPREINTNALLIANNLYLDRPTPKTLAETNNGDIYISPVSDVNTPGIQFESPVFVNGNIFVPEPDAPIYTPVTFADKVIVAAGMIFQSNNGSNALYSFPKNAGGSEDRFYSQSKTFGGFLKGVLLDPGPDEGLKVLAQVDGPSTATATDANLCILRSAAKTDLTLTRDSQLFLKVNSASNTTASGVYAFTAHLGDLNNFYRQSKPSPVQFKSLSPASLEGNVTFPANPDLQRPIMRLSIGLNGYIKNPSAYIVADLSFSSVLDIRMNENDPSAILRVTTSEHVVGANPQNNAVDIKVEMINQDKFAMFPYPVQLPLSNLTSTSEPSIDFNIEAFDAAYTTDSSGKISSQRTNGVSSCSAADADYSITDPETHSIHCYPRYNWHPKMGKYKTNGFKLKRDFDSVDPRFKLQYTAGASVAPANTYLGCSALNTTCPSYDKVHYPKDPDRDWVAFDRSCFNPPTGTAMFPSFAAADWDTVSFTQQARRSWGFTEPGTSAYPGYNPGDLILDEKSALFDGTTKPTFIVSAIYNNCVITERANFVAGFFVCDNLIIAARNSPLRIIGTFITSKMSIDPTAMNNGIRWSNIYHPSAVFELRNAGILNTSVDGENCDVPAEPLWHPYPSVQRTQFLFKCNPISLRNKADPFTWTLVDPDCGLVGNIQQCKYRTMRFELVELKRQEFL